MNEAYGGDFDSMGAIFMKMAVLLKENASTLR
jgi:hypothetical protein